MRQRVIFYEFSLVLSWREYAGYIFRFMSVAVR